MRAEAAGRLSGARGVQRSNWRRRSISYGQGLARYWRKQARLIAYEARRDAVSHASAGAVMKRSA